ncbi:metal ABC transporter permease [Actinomadura vinacea]|uniref:metal ABC transporter permease n=1 Tax=Actinomadura vinacea TaxID=115336 RepID=UPI003CD07C11
MRALGYRAHSIDGGLLALLAITVVTAVPAVGATPPLALLVGPTAAALLWTRRIVPAMALGVLLGAGSAVAGRPIHLPALSGRNRSQPPRLSAASCSSPPSPAASPPVADRPCLPARLPACDPSGS